MTLCGRCDVLALLSEAETLVKSLEEKRLLDPRQKLKSVVVVLFVLVRRKKDLVILVLNSFR